MLTQEVIDNMKLRTEEQDRDEWGKVYLALERLADTLQGPAVDLLRDLAIDIKEKIIGYK